jgi:hypothetical protein
VAYFLLALSGFVGSGAAWLWTQPHAFNLLNGCVDPNASLSRLGEQAYVPSQGYLDCTEGPHRTAFLLAAVALSAVCLVTMVGLVLLTQYLVFADYVRLDNKPTNASKVFSRIYRGFGVAALVLVIAVLILVGPKS